MKAQATDEERRAVATHLLDNGTDPEALVAQVDALWSDLQPATPTSPTPSLTRRTAIPTPRPHFVASSEPAGSVTATKSRSAAARSSVRRTVATVRARSCDDVDHRRSRSTTPACGDEAGSRTASAWRSSSDEWCSLAVDLDDDPALPRATKSTPTDRCRSSLPRFTCAARLRAALGPDEIDELAAELRSPARPCPSPRSVRDAPDELTFRRHRATEIARDPDSSTSVDVTAVRARVSSGAGHRSAAHHGDQAEHRRARSSSGRHAPSDMMARRTCRRAARPRAAGLHRPSECTRASPKSPSARQRLRTAATGRIGARRRTPRALAVDVRAPSMPSTPRPRGSQRPRGARGRSWRCCRPGGAPSDAEQSELLGRELLDAPRSRRSWPRTVAKTAVTPRSGPPPTLCAGPPGAVGDVHKVRRGAGMNVTPRA